MGAEHRVMNLYWAQGNPWTALNPQYTLVPNSADRGSDVGQITPTIRTMWGGGGLPCALFRFMTLWGGITESTPVFAQCEIADVGWSLKILSRWFSPICQLQQTTLSGLPCRPIFIDCRLLFACSEIELCPSSCSWSVYLVVYLLFSCCVPSVNPLVEPPLKFRRPICDRHVHAHSTVLTLKLSIL